MAVMPAPKVAGAGCHGITSWDSPEANLCISLKSVKAGTRRRGMSIFCRKCLGRLAVCYSGTYT